MKARKRRAKVTHNYNRALSPVKAVRRVAQEDRARAAPGSDGVAAQCARGRHGSCTSTVCRCTMPYCLCRHNS